MAQFNAILWLSEVVDADTWGNTYLEYKHSKEFWKEKKKIPEDCLGEEKKKKVLKNKTGRAK